MEPPYSPKHPQKVVIPPGTFNADENTIIDLPDGLDEDIFVATKPRSQRPPVSSTPIRHSRGQPGSLPGPPHTEHSIVTVGPEPAELETREQQNLEEDLKNFQSARRKLYYDVLTLQMTKLRKGIKKRVKEEMK